MKIRTRYAPSPTGFFHIGGARTALFNYLFAKHNNGDFIVRIEDTDIERNVDNGIESQLNNLEWLNIFYDESIKNPKNHGPYIQSEKFEKYKKIAHELVSRKKAYYCFCSKDQLDSEREKALANHQTPKYNRNCLNLSEDQINEFLANKKEYTIRLIVDEEKNYEWDDLIRGKISVPGSAMTDPVILKSNEIAMYNFAVVIDDYDMEISHVLRGEEHISNTPYQLAITDALGYDRKIKYGHLSIITDETGKKLSKRNEKLKQFIEDYKNSGYLPEAMFNFLALLGWTPANNKEMLSIDEIIKSFDILSVSKSPAFFDVKKLNWLNNQYIRQMSDDDYIKFVSKFVTTNNQVYLKNINSVLLLFKKQLLYGNEINSLIDSTFNLDADIEIVKQKINLNFNFHIVELFYNKILNLEKFDIENINNLIKNIGTDLNVSGKNLFMPIRLAATFNEHGPELAKTIYLFSKDTIISNLKKILN